MDHFVARQNIDHYLAMLDKSALKDEDRATVNRLLVWEEDKLASDQECLSFAEERLIACEKRVGELQRLRDQFPLDSREWELAGELLANFKNTVTIVWKCCQRLRLQIAHNPI